MEPVVSSLIAGLFGAVAAAIPVWAIARRQPSRRVADTVSIIDVSGEIIEHLREEVKDLRAEVASARQRADDSKVVADELRRRVNHLEQAVRLLGGNPDTIVSTGK